MWSALQIEPQRDGLEAAPSQWQGGYATSGWRMPICGHKQGLNKSPPWKILSKGSSQNQWRLCLSAHTFLLHKLATWFLFIINEKKKTIKEQQALPLWNGSIHLILYISYCQQMTKKDQNQQTLSPYFWFPFNVFSPLSLWPLIPTEDVKSLKTYIASFFFKLIHNFQKNSFDFVQPNLYVELTQNKLMCHVYHNEAIIHSNCVAHWCVLKKHLDKTGALWCRGMRYIRLSLHRDNLLG